MATLLTVEIHSPKDPREKWIINLDDYDASKHTLWDELTQSQQGTVSNPVDEAVSTPAPVVDTKSSLVHSGMRPSVQDYVHDDDGNIVAVNIIDPERRTSRKEIPYGDYDPDIHELWSEHPRFH